MRPDDDGSPLRRAFATLYGFLALDHTPAPSDAIVCFGSRDHVVPEHAARLFHARLAPVVVATGGVELAPYGRSEASVFASRLVELDVPAERILLEEHSRHTGDNVRLSIETLAARNGLPQSVITVAWPMVARRIVATMAARYPTVRVCSSPSMSVPGTAPRPTAGATRWAVEQFDRLVRYSGDGTIAPVDIPDEVVIASEVVRASLEHQLDGVTSRRPRRHLDRPLVDHGRKPVIEVRQRAADRMGDQVVGKPHVLREQRPV